MRDNLAHEILVEGEGESQILHIAFIMLDIGQVLMKLRVRGWHLIQVAENSDVRLTQHFILLLTYTEHYDHVPVLGSGKKKQMEHRLLCPHIQPGDKY